MIKIVIPEPITSLNKGEAAILEGIYEALKLLGRFEISVYSTPDWIFDDKRNYENKYKVVGGIDFFNVGYSYKESHEKIGIMFDIKKWGKLLVFSILYRLYSRLSNFFIKDDLLNAMSKADLLIAGHDGMLAFDDFWLVLAAKIMGKPIALFGGGNDGKGRSKYRIRKFYQFAVNNSILCTVRDVGTRKFLVDNDVAPEKVHVFPDPAVLLKPCSDKRVEEILRLEGISRTNETPIYGLVPVRGGIVAKKSFDFEQNSEKRYQLRIKLWVDALEHLLDETHAHFIFLPHCIGPTPNNDDRRMSKDVYNSLKQDHDRFTLIENEYSAGELKGLIKSFQFILGERTHALIGSLSAATPCVALTVKEDQRMHKIVNKMFNQQAFNLNDPNLAALKLLLSRQWEKRDKIHLELIKLSKRAYEDAFAAAKLLKERFEEFNRS
jgi:polysaccharide pyruvyl transferase WcaK-like protein